MKRILGQSAPSATTNTTVYTVPTDAETVVSSLVLCNRGSSTLSYRVMVIPSGDTLSNENYIAYEFDLPGKAGDSVVIGLTLTEGDKVDVYASNGNLSVSLFGDESAIV